MRTQEEYDEFERLHAKAHVRIRTLEVDFVDHERMLQVQRDRAESAETRAEKAEAALAVCRTEAHKLYDMVIKARAARRESGAELQPESPGSAWMSTTAAKPAALIQQLPTLEFDEPKPAARRHPETEDGCGT
jgi:hypothetical protein